MGESFGIVLDRVFPILGGLLIFDDGPAMPQVRRKWFDCWRHADGEVEGVAGRLWFFITPRRLLRVERRSWLVADVCLCVRLLLSHRQRREGLTVG